MMITFTVPGQPQGKQRARSGKGGRHYTPQKTREYEALVAALASVAMRGRPPMTGPVGVTISTVRAWPKAPGKGHECRARGPRWCTTGADLDNVAKAICDGMTLGRVYGDDRQVAVLKCEKWWADEGKEPSVHVVAYELGERP